MRPLFRSLPLRATLLCRTVLAVPLLLGCSSTAPAPTVPLTAPTVLCRNSDPAPCRAPSEAVALLRDPDLEIVAAVDAHQGVQSAHILTLDSHGRTFRAKFRAYADSNTYSSGRKELAAYATQALFLDEADYVVPPAAGHCFSLESYRRHIDPGATASFDKADCVFGVLSYWIEDGKSIDEAVDANLLDDDTTPYAKALFEFNERYRTTLGNTNLVNYLIRNADTHQQQFLLAGSDQHVYIVDNSTSFGSAINERLAEHQHWHKLQVPLPVKSLSSLRLLQAQDFDRLLVVEQYEVSGGRLVAAEPTISAAAWKVAGYQWKGDTLLSGLSDLELADVKKRWSALLTSHD